MNRNDRGYALLISMISLVLLTTLTGLLVFSSQSDMRRSQITRSDLQAHYVAETGITKALVWFRNSYTLPASTLVNTSPGTPPSVTDPMGRTYTTNVSLTNGSPVVLNATGTGTATTHPPAYTNLLNTNITNLTTSFTTSMGNQSVSLDADGTGTFSVMATLIRYSPERWRIDSAGTFSGKTKFVSMWIERLPLTPYIQAAYTAASPVDLTGNQSIDGRDHALDGTNLGAGLPGVAVTSTNPMPDVSGSGAIRSTVSGSTVTVDSGTVYPSPLPANYPVTNTLDPNVYPYTPAAALGLDPGVYQPYLDSKATTTIPCVIQGLVVLDRNFPTGSGGGGCDYSGTGIMILHNPRYDPRFFDPTNPLYSSSTSPVAGQTAAQYRSDSANQPRYFNYNASNNFKGIIIADSIGEIGPGITGNANILGAIISLDRVNGSVGTGNATIGYSTAAINNAINSIPYTKQRGTFRHLTQ